jgi:hypothetical protein
MKKTKSKTVQVNEETVRDALHLLKRVVVHGNEQSMLFNVYASLQQSLTDTRHTD